MRLVRLVLATVFLCGLGWFAVRTVSFEATDEELRITINRQQLRQAGSELGDKGRRAASHMRQMFQRAGTTNGDADQPSEHPAEPLSFFRR